MGAAQAEEVQGRPEELRPSVALRLRFERPLKNAIGRSQDIVWSEESDGTSLQSILDVFPVLR
jgi:hypothetical protein